MTAEVSFKKYPYFLFPQAEALSAATDSAQRELLARRVATYIGDPIALRALLGLDPEEFVCFYPDQAQPDLSTYDTISTFLQRFGKGEEDMPSAGGGEVAVAPAIDYVTMLDRMEAEADAPMPDAEGRPGATADATTEAIDGFLAAMAPASIVPEENVQAEDTPAEEGQAEEVLSAAAARAKIAEGDYGKALDIITKLQVLAPENPYFEDQIRFLRKLIINSTAK
ncbi:MAG: hypothetical protein HDS43_05300 [Bacteroides sp.]|nr:hypothetical protein [Bacteroides sp.]